MNDDETLERAFQALRESADGSRPDGRATRARVLVGAARRRARARRVAFVLMPLAATLVLSTAWAAFTGRLRREPVVHAPPSAARSPAPAAPPMAPATVDAPTSPAGSSATPPASTPVPQAPPRAPSAAPAPGARSVTAREQSLYAAAHKAHFVDKDPAEALRLWDAYLAAYPSGRFALEARYNRAISLVRLGRNDEAREALTPFARGDFGEYRRAEARDLLDALGSGP